MILHLNPVNFQEYGIILPERKHDKQVKIAEQPGFPLSLTTADMPIYQAQEEVLLRNESGITILSVAGHGEGFKDYYLDKPVRLRAGVQFSLAALRGTSVVRLQAENMPQAEGCYTRKEDLSISRHLHVTRLYTFFYHEKENGFLFAGEAHPMLELTYVDQGSLHSVADGVDWLLEQGDMMLYAPEQWHMQHSDVEVAPRYVTISFDISGGDISRLYNRKIKTSQKAVVLLQQMLREQERMDSLSGDMLLSLLTQLLLTLLREADSPAQRLQSAYALRSENEIISRAQRYISTHIQEKLSVPVVARNSNISPSYLTALFHKHLQISPGEYIRRIKLQESKQMIRENSMNFTQIATALQYSTVHHFSRQFKEKFGITPTEYAKSVR